MGNYNRVILVGNLVRDPEIRYVQSGSPVTKFTIAVNRRTKQEDSVDYIDVVAWEKLAQTTNTYLRKGASILVEGRLSMRSYESKSGEKHRAAEVVMSLMQMLNRNSAAAGDDQAENPEEDIQTAS